MKTKLTLLAFSCSLVLAAPALLAQDTNTYNTNALPLNQTVKYQKAFENDRSLGERCLLLPGLKEKLKLTAEQRTELKPIEKDFAIIDVGLKTEGRIPRMLDKLDPNAAAVLLDLEAEPPGRRQLDDTARKGRSRTVRVHRRD